MQILKHHAVILEDVMKHDPLALPQRGPRPPSQVAQAMAATQHALCKGKRQWRCSRCSSSMVLRKGKLKQWLLSPCCPLEAQASARPTLRPTGTVQVGHQQLHSSHDAAFEPLLEVWFCRTCGFYGDQNLRNLAEPCTRTLNKTGRQNLVRISKGLMPGASQRAKLFNAQSMRSRGVPAGRPASKGCTG